MSVGGVFILFVTGLIIIIFIKKYMCKKPTNSYIENHVRKIEISQPIINEMPRIVVPTTDKFYEEPLELGKVSGRNVSTTLEKSTPPGTGRSVRLNISEEENAFPPSEFVRGPKRLTVHKMSAFNFK